MAVLLFSVGSFALVAGLVMVGFGIPINEFSFGNTLISAGTTATVGGLVIIALGIAVGQLRRIAESLTGQSAARFGQPMDIVDVAGTLPVAAPGRPHFPQRPKADTGQLASAAVNAVGDDDRNPFEMPTLRNPVEAPMAVDDDIPLSPPAGLPASESFGDRPRSFGPQPMGPGERVFADKNQEPTGRKQSAPPIPSPGSPRPIQPAKFDAMWPAEAKAAKSNTDDTRQQPVTPPREPLGAVLKRAEPEAQKPRAVAILKSGVVDGMGYTLYVDGSIEAELPQGTLRFASINELRSHLEKNS